MKQFIIDIETGGLNPYIDGILSISIKPLSEDKKVKTWFIKPQQGKLYSHSALRVNKLTIEDLPEKVSLRMMLDDLQFNWLNEKQVTLIGHNIEFDLKFLMQAAKECGVKLPIIYYICTMDLANIYLKKEKIIKSIKLTEVYNYFYPKDENNLLLGAHTSKCDVLMTEHIFNDLWSYEMKNA